MSESAGTTASLPSAKGTEAPRSQGELSHAEFESEFATLRTSPLFWLGCVLKLTCAGLFGSHFATRWFAPFAYEFVHSHFANPWAHFVGSEPLAFPYGPSMLALASIPFAPALFSSFDPSSHLGLFLLRVPLFAADLTICILLMRWLRLHARAAIAGYWLSPIVLYATYVHGQLDLIPTALLCVALFLMFSQRIVIAGIVLGVGLAAKLHLLIALPFALVYLYRQQKRPRAAYEFGAATLLTVAALYAPVLGSNAFRKMVFGSHEAEKIWAVSVPYGFNGLVLYIAPAALFLAFLRFASYRKVNRELTLMFIGAMYVALVALVPPQPGWFIWSIPFVAYLSVRFTRTGRYVLGALSLAYLGYFFVGDPQVFLEAFDPVAGASFGMTAAADLNSNAPQIFGAHGASIAWTLLFSTTVLTAIEMYRKGVRSNGVYRFREQSFMIGVGGDSGAGKHTLGRDLAAVLGPQLSLINGDDDHKWERGHAMWRRYTHLDPRGNLLHAQADALAALRRGGDVHKRHYDHDAGRFTNPLLLRPSDFVAIVGLHPFYLPTQRQLLELKVFVDPLEDLRRNWKVARDMAKRGYTREQVIAQIEQRSEDSQKYVRPQIKYADLVVRQRASNDDVAQLDMEIELAAVLDPLAFLAALESFDTLEVGWKPDEGLNRDVISIVGRISKEQLDALVTALIPNSEELVHQGQMPDGGRGIAVAAVLHAISTRLRGTSTGVEVA